MVAGSTLPTSSGTIPAKLIPNWRYCGSRIYSKLRHTDVDYNLASTDVGCGGTRWGGGLEANNGERPPITDSTKKMRHIAI
eukprot:1667751-Rhodomonas_salina.8